MSMEAAFESGSRFPVISTERANEAIKIRKMMYEEIGRVKTPYYLNKEDLIENGTPYCRTIGRPGHLAAIAAYQEKVAAIRKRVEATTPDKIWSYVLAMEADT